MALVGNTVKLTGYFKDFEGNVVDADTVKITISDYKGEIDTIDLTEQDKTADGGYTTFYVIPEGTGELKFEIFGMVNGYPELGILREPRER